MSDNHLNLFTDGACRGNPGQAGAGIVLVDASGKIVATCCKYLGLCTNNIAEYKALIIGLEEALKRHCKQVGVYLDSELLVNQINGTYRVKNENLKMLMKEVRKLLSFFENYTVEHIPRSQNTTADQLANKAIDDVC
jgi:ribonuclease HI/probable phosphoglycerate mutase